MERAKRTSNPLSANGQKLGYVGETIVNLKIGEMMVENVRVALLKDISHTLILGNNLLMQLGIKIEKGGTKMDIGSEKDIPVMGVNGVLQNTQMCGMIQNEDLFLNSLNDVVTESSDPWTWQSDQLLSISSTSDNIDDNSRTVIQNFIGEKQESHPTHLTNINNIFVENEKETKKGKVNIEGLTDLKDPRIIKTLTELINKHANLFSKHEFDIGSYKNEHGEDDPVTLYVKDENVMVNQFTRRIPISYRPWLEDQLNKMEQHRIIEPVQAKHGPAWLSNLLIVPKPGTDKLRLCFDLREVNKNVISEQWPLPNIKDCIESMAGARLFTCLDLRAAYHAIEIEESSRRYLGFGYQGKQYVYRKMPFGLAAAPSIFCRYMSRVLGNINKEFYNLYMDDCVIYSKNVN